MTHPLTIICLIQIGATTVWTLFERATTKIWRLTEAGPLIVVWIEKNCIDCYRRQILNAVKKSLITDEGFGSRYNSRWSLLLGSWPFKLYYVIDRDATILICYFWIYETIRYTHIMWRETPLKETQRRNAMHRTWKIELYLIVEVECIFQLADILLQMFHRFAQMPRGVPKVVNFPPQLMSRSVGLQLAQ